MKIRWDCPARAGSRPRDQARKFCILASALCNRFSGPFLSVVTGLQSFSFSERVLVNPRLHRRIPCFTCASFWFSLYSSGSRCPSSAAVPNIPQTSSTCWSQPISKCPTGRRRGQGLPNPLPSWGYVPILWVRMSTIPRRRKKRLTKRSAKSRLAFWCRQPM